MRINDKKKKYTKVYKEGEEKYTECHGRIAASPGPLSHHLAPKLGYALTGKKFLVCRLPKTEFPIRGLLPFTTRAGTRSEYSYISPPP